MKKEITGNENFKVKEYEIYHTGGGIWVAYGIYTNGLGFQQGSAGLAIYDVDGRDELDADDDYEWEQAHIVWNDFRNLLTSGTKLYQSTLRQIYNMECDRVDRTSNKVVSVLDYYDLFYDNEDILKNKGNKKKVKEDIFDTGYGSPYYNGDDEEECERCGENTPTSELHNTNYGKICDYCIQAIKSRGEKVRLRKESVRKGIKESLHFLSDPWKGRFSKSDNWVGGELEYSGATYKVQAKVFDEPSQYGINNGRISKLWVKEDGYPVAIDYDRGWVDGVPPYNEDLLNFVMKEVEKFKDKHPTPKGKGIKESADDLSRLLKRGLKPMELCKRIGNHVDFEHWNELIDYINDYFKKNPVDLDDTIDFEFLDDYEDGENIEVFDDKSKTYWPHDFNKASGVFEDDYNDEIIISKTNKSGVVYIVSNVLGDGFTTMKDLKEYFNDESTFNYNLQEMAKDCEHLGQCGEKIESLIENGPSFYQRNPYTGRKSTTVKDGIAVKDHWVQDFVGNRHFIKKGTKVNEFGMPIKDTSNPDVEESLVEKLSALGKILDESVKINENFRSEHYEDLRSVPISAVKKGDLVYVTNGMYDVCIGEFIRNNGLVTINGGSPGKRFEQYEYVVKVIVPLGYGVVPNHITNGFTSGYVEVYVGELSTDEMVRRRFVEKVSPEGYAPKQTGKAYKVFRVKNGKLYPPMVANVGGADTPIGVWLDAEEGEFAGLSKTGRPQVKSTGSGNLAYRPGWHLGDVPRAPQFDRRNKETGEMEFPADFVWAECDYAMDIDYQPEADERGYMRTKVDDKGNVSSYRSDKYQHSLAGLPKLPTNGYYKYRTNPRPDTVPWVITGQMKVNRLLSDDEVNEILRKNGVEPIHRQGGDKTLKELGLKEGLKESLLKEDTQIWKSDTVIDYAYDTDIDELKAELDAMEVDYEGWDEDQIRNYFIDDPVRGEIEYEDFKYNLLPAIDNQCFGDVLVLFGDSANWQGTRAATKVLHRADDLERYIYPNYDATTTIYEDDKGIYYTQSTHDTPMGGTKMYLYSLKGETDLEELDKWCSESEWFDPDYDYSVDFLENNTTYKDIKDLIDKGILTPIKNIV